MKTKLVKNLILGLVSIGVCHSAWAQPAGQTNYQWSAAGDKATWSQPANWTQGIQPQTDGTTFQIDTSVNAGGSVVPINIASTDVVAINDAIFGPLGGQTLNVSGNVNCGFGEFVWGDINGPVTTLNVNPNATLTLRDTLALGTAWWFPAGPHVVMNVYSNAQVNVTWLQFGSILNLYGGTVSVTNGLNTGAATAPVFGGGLDSDATRAINLTAGSTLVLPATYTATVNDWITRGILQVYGVPQDPMEIVISETNTTWPGRTVVTTTATNGHPILAVHVSVPRTNMSVGGLQQAQVFADYAITTNVNISSTAGISITYQSIGTNVATVTAGGQVRATGVGTALIRAIIGTLSNSISVKVTTYTNTAMLVHRYSFSDDVGSGVVTDSVPGNNPAWDGALLGGATTSGGTLTLDGMVGYVQFQPGILVGMDAVTIETWASLGTIPPWAVLFTFGDSDGTFGHNYISCQPHTGGTTAQTGIKNLLSEQNPFFTPVLDNYTNVHIVAVYHPEAGYCSIYTNGVLAVINNSIQITMADAMATGDPINYIGRSLYSADPYLATTMDEFRIYQGPMSASQVMADYALGPNQTIGTNTNVSLNATVSSGKIQLKWPVNSALVTIWSSPKLGAGANWTPMVAPLSIVGGNYQATVSLTSSAQFFRLSQ